ncbi:MAG TPA: hypothetical protein EYP14_20675, partial [Planctomycetaceae bacterium]|nr:hypothetical protein [Planctomycetaceae bacterium]
MICFDQVEAMQRTQCDVEAMFAFGQLVSTLHADTRNLVLITCVQSAFLDLMRRNIRDADYDRMGEFAIETLSPLPWPLAKKLLVARLDSVPELKHLRNGQPELWPLQEKPLEEMVGPMGMSARRLIEAASVQFARAQTGEVPERVPLDQSLQDTFSRLFEKGEELSWGEIEDAIAQGLPLLVTVLAPDWRLGETADLQDVDLRLERKDQRIDISICMHEHMTGLAARLRRLVAQWKGSGQSRLVLIRPLERPIPKTAKKTRERLNTLTERGAALIHPSGEVVAALDALRKLLSDAKAGDLSHNGETVSPETVQEWLQKNLPSCVEDFAAAILAGDPLGTKDRLILGELLELLSREHVIALEDAARKLAIDRDELWRAAQTQPDLVGT